MPDIIIKKDEIKIQKQMESNTSRHKEMMSISGEGCQSKPLEL